MTSDAALAAAAASGDRGAFEQLYRRYRPDLLNLVGRQVGDRHLAEDIVHECSLLGWREIATLRDPASVKTWLFSIARRLAMSQRRRPAVAASVAGRPERAASAVHSGGILLRVGGVAALVVGLAAGTYAFALDDPRTPNASTPLAAASPSTSLSPSLSLAPSPSGSPSATASPSLPAAPVPATSAPVSLSPEQQMLQLINQRRAEAGCGPVRSDDRLAQAAAAHSADMAAQSYFSHTSLDGSTPWDRARRAGYEWASAENIAAGNATAQATMDQFMNSPGHRNNILNCDHQAVGVGRATGGPYRYYWTQLFGSR
jgi:uncharacterized protein YkwD